MRPPTARPIAMLHPLARQSGCISHVRRIAGRKVTPGAILEERMEPSDLTVEILKSIRDGVHATNERIEQLRTDVSGRLEELRTELSERLDRVERRQAGAEVRIASELVAVVAAIGEVKDAVLEDRQLRRTVEDHETRLQAIERRLPT